MRSIFEFGRLTLVIAGMLCASYAQVLPLLSNVEVARDTVRLSDLTPARVASQILLLGGDVGLGRAPQLGSVRSLERSQILHSLGGMPDLARRLEIPDRVTVRRAGYVIDREVIRRAVAEFLRAKGLGDGLPASALQPAPEVLALVQDPMLEAVAVNWDPERRHYQARLRCRQRSECGDFLVYLTAPRGVRGKPEGQRQSEAGKSDVGPMLIAAGQKATLCLESRQIRMEVQVICLQRGRLGQRIRVLDRASHRVYQAEITGPGVVRSNLES